MLIIDDILLSPVKGFMWIMRELHNAVEQELEDESARLTTSLSDLYMMLETGMISEEEFAAQEKEILDRLDAAQGVEDDAAETDADDLADEEDGESEDDEADSDDGGDDSSNGGLTDAAGAEDEEGERA